MITEASQAIAALHAEQHRQEKQMIALEAQLQRASEDSTKVTLKGDSSRANITSRTKNATGSSVARRKHAPPSESSTNSGLPTSGSR